MKKIIPSLIFTLFFLQSCVVYQKMPVSLDEATNMGNAKVVFIEEDYQTFQNITLKDGDYYGLKKSNVVTVLDPIFVEAVYLQNISGSKSGNAVMRIISVAGLVIVSFVMLYFLVPWD